MESVQPIPAPARGGWVAAPVIDAIEDHASDEDGDRGTAELRGAISCVGNRRAPSKISRAAAAFVVALTLYRIMRKNTNLSTNQMEPI